MARVTGPLFSMEASGQFGGAMVFAKNRGVPYVRTLVTPSNPDSAAQQAVRAAQKWLSQIWKTIGGTDQGTWKVPAAADNVAPFNKFMSANRDYVTAGKAPTSAFAHAEGDTLPTMGSQSATGHAGYASISVGISVAQGGWGVIIYDSTTSGFTPGPSNIAQILTVSGTTTLTWDDKNLVAGNRYYKVIPFTKQGKLGTAGAEMTAVVT